jgi:2-oxoglutarate dehydrogenase E2 component (dihydrolipoamide succinyltransferase)
MTSITVPPLGESIVEATVSRWLKQEGDAVASGDTIVELETDKITVEVPSMEAGVLAKRAHAEGDVVKVGDLLAEIDQSGASAATSKPAAAPSAGAPAAAAPAPQAPSAPPSASAAAPAPTQAPAPASGDLRASPAAQREAAARGVELSSVAGTGRGGVIAKPDVIEHAERGGASAAAPAPSAMPSAPAPASPATETRPAPAPSRPAAAAAPTPPPAGQRETREKLSTRRRKIAEHLLESQHATAHLTTFNEIDMSAVTALRERHKERVEKQHGVKLSFMPFFVKAACLALADYPTVNAQLDGDSIVYKHYVNMGIAVASDAGLVVPNLKDADRKGMVEISRDIVAVAKRARDGKLTMDDLTGGTFTITNGGVFGSLISTPILNYPQVAILGLHKTQDRPVAIQGRVEIRPMMYVALSYDHRIIDGQQAVLFLVRVTYWWQDPGALLFVSPPRAPPMGRATACYIVRRRNTCSRPTLTGFVPRRIQRWPRQSSCRSDAAPKIASAFCASRGRSIWSSPRGPGARCSRRRSWRSSRGRRA